jgi:hypothetical protein
MQNSQVRVTVSDRTGEGEPKTLRGKTMIEIWWWRAGRWQRIMRYTCYSLQEGIELALWYFRASQAVSLETFADTRTSDYVRDS